MRNFKQRQKHAGRACAVLLSVMMMTSVSVSPVLAADGTSGDGRSIDFPYYTVEAEAFNAMVTKLPSVKKVQESDREAIEAARAAYEELSDYDKEEWCQRSYKTLCALEEALKNIKDREENPVTPVEKTHYTENIATMMPGKDFNVAVKKMDGSITQSYQGASTSDLKVGSIAFYSGGKVPEDVDLSALESVVVSEAQAEGEENAAPEIRAYWDPKDPDVKGDDAIYVVSSGNIQLNPDCQYMFSDFSKVTSLDLAQVDTSKVENMSQFFLYNRPTELDLRTFDTSNVTDMSSMFGKCYDLKDLDLSSFDTSKVTTMNNMFSNCSGLSELDLSSFDTSNVTSMSNMFADCTAMKEVDLSSFNTENVTTMYRMFYHCDSVETLDLSSFKTQNVKDMKEMFSMTSNKSSKLTSVDLSGFDTSKVPNMQSMFAYCTSLESLDVSSFDTSNVTTMYSMFSFCESLKELDVSMFDTSRVENMSNMFSYMTNLEYLDVSGFDTSSCTSMSNMFCYAQSLKTLDLHSFDTSNVTSMYGMFMGAKNMPPALVTIYVTGSKFVTDQIASGYNSNSIFSGCTSLVGQAGTKYNAKQVNKAYAHVDESGNPGYFTEYDFEGTELTLNPDSTRIIGSTIMPVRAQTYLVYNSTGKQKYKEAYTYTSSDDSVATIDENGNITGISDGTAVITVTGKITGLSETVEIEVYRLSIEDARVPAVPDQTYTGSAVEPEIVLTNGDYPLTAGKDYTVTYGENINVGTAKATAEGVGRYKGTVEVEFEIVPMEIGDAEIADIEDQYYIASPVTPALTILNGKTALVEGTDYEAAYENNIEMGTAVVTVTGIGNFTGEASKEFEIVKKDGTAIIAAGEKNYVVESGEGFTLPATDNGEEGKEVSSWKGTLGKYSRTFLAGEEMSAEDIERLTDNNDEIALTPFYASKAVSLETKKASVEAEEAIWTGSEVTPKVTVKHGSAVLTENEDYVVSYENNVDLGTGTAIVQGVGLYKGTITADFAIVKSEEQVDAEETAAALETTVEEAKAVSNSDGTYTAESYKALTDAIAAAEKVAADPNASAKDLKAALDKVAAAKAALVKTSDQKKDQQKEQQKDTKKGKTVTKGKSYKVAGATYQVKRVATAKATGSVLYKKAPNKKAVTVPKTVKLADGKSYKVEMVGAKAFTGKKIRTVTISANVKKINKNAFAKSKTTKVIVKSKLLKKASVKGSLRGAKVKTVQVKVGNKKLNKKYVKKYKKIFTKANAGRKVKVK